MHEAACHSENSFVTLTLDEEHIPSDGSLDKRAVPLFIKRLRRTYAPRVRYFYAGEYGAKLARPHYHALLFGYDWPDKVQLAERGGFPVWGSAMLTELWGKGRTEVGSVTFASASYVARYLCKPGSERLVYNGETGEIVSREREFARMSRRPGLGAEWYARFHGEVFPSDGVLVSGKLAKPPRYYMDRFRESDPESAAAVCVQREARRRLEDETRERLLVREKVFEAKVKVFSHSMEDV